MIPVVDVREGGRVDTVAAAAAVVVVVVAVVAIVVAASVVVMVPVKVHIEGIILLHRGCSHAVGPLHAPQILHVPHY